MIIWRTKTWSPWDIVSLKWCVFIFGIIIGGYFPAWVMVKPVVADGSFHPSCDPAGLCVLAQKGVMRKAMPNRSDATTCHQTIFAPDFQDQRV